MSTRKPSKEAESTRKPIPFAKIEKMYKDGQTIERIAKAIRRFNEEYDDPTKSVRAIISGMITRGYKNEAGRVVKLKKRDRTGKPGGTAKGQKAPQKGNPTPKTQKPARASQKATGKAKKTTRNPLPEPIPELVTE